ncbi:MAG: Gfo/Idh/MocA family oxidoreductase [Bdellovibrionota bacterium]
MIIQPYILGSGRAGQAMLKGLAVLELSDAEFSFKKAIKIERAQPLKDVVKNDEFSLLLIANPHALHAAKILEAEGLFDLIVTEKPVCTSLEEIESLKKVKTPVAVCHGYRQSWGVQSLKKMIEAGDFGEILSIEGRYWQSSTAQRSLEKNTAQTWKNDPTLSGPHDALLDIATHWADTAIFLMPHKLKETALWLSYVNAEAKHRDTHIHMSLSFEADKRALCSISKMVHGAANHFEVNVVGAKKFATWKFLEPDLLEVSEGAARSFVSRKETRWGSTQGPHHAMGWLEGYIEIFRQALRDATGKPSEPYPNLQEALHVIEALLTAKRT